MPIDFPPSPSAGVTYSYGGILWTYNGVAWDKTTSGSISTYVATLNGLSGGVNVAGGTSISVTPTGNTLTIAYTGGGGGGGGGGTYYDFIQGTTATTGPTAGDRWYDTGTGKLLTAVTDGASNIWVEFGGAGPQGNAGNTGATGATGSQGIQGNTGATGAGGVDAAFVIAMATVL